MVNEVALLSIFSLKRAKDKIDCILINALMKV